MKPAYYRQASKILLLTAAQEIELARIIKTGASVTATEKEIKAGKRARDKFARSNLRLVLKVANFYENKAGKLDFDDLVQLGNLGLIRAIEKFDHERGYKFSTYAVAWIRQSIQRGIMNHSRTIRLPTHAHDDMTRIKKLIAQRKAGGSSERISDEVIASELNIPFGRYMEMRRMWFDARSTDAPVYQNDEFSDLPMLDCETGQSMDYAPVIDGERESSQVDMLFLAIDGLPAQEREVIVARYGLDGREPETLDVIGARLGLPREWVRQTQASLTDKLRSLLA